jgi:hypothetical protein
MSNSRLTWRIQQAKPTSRFEICLRCDKAAPAAKVEFHFRNEQGEKLVGDYLEVKILDAPSPADPEKLQS